MNRYVLVHGLPDHSGTWEKLIPIISGISNEIAIIGLPGIGDNILLDEKLNFIQIAKMLVDKIPFKNVIYVGHDFGGMLGNIIAQIYPDLISKMILINGPSPDILQKEIKQNQTQSNLSKYVDKIVSNPEINLSFKDYSFLKAFLFREEIFASEQYKSSLIELWNKTYTLKNIGTYYRSFLTTKFNNIHYNQDTLQIWSEFDPFLSKEVSFEMINRFSNHKILNLSTDSHWPQLSHFNCIKNEILDFERK